MNEDVRGTGFSTKIGGDKAGVKPRTNAGYAVAGNDAYQADQLTPKVTNTSKSIHAILVSWSYLASRVPRVPSRREQDLGFTYEFQHLRKELAEDACHHERFTAPRNHRLPVFRAPLPFQRSVQGLLRHPLS